MFVCRACTDSVRFHLISVDERECLGEQLRFVVWVCSVLIRCLAPVLQGRLAPRRVPRGLLLQRAPLGPRGRVRALRLVCV